MTREMWQVLRAYYSLGEEGDWKDVDAVVRELSHQQGYDKERATQLVDEAIRRGCLIFNEPANAELVSITS